MDTILLLLDTNTFLHYISLEQIDWKGLLPNSQIVLTVSPPLIRELNRHKDAPRSSKLRDRAAVALRSIDGWADEAAPFILRDGVEIRFRVNESQINFASEGLVRDIADDHFVATLIDMRSEAQPNESVRLLSRDTGLKLKARARGFAVLSLPDELSLPAEVLPDEKRLKELEAQVKELKNARPQLSLSFSGGNNYLNVTFERSEPLPVFNVPDEMSALRREHLPMTPRSSTQSARGHSAIQGVFSSLSMISNETIESYNRSLEQYFKQYEAYLTRLNEFYEWQSRTAKISLSLINSGTLPADDVDIFMHFPDGFELFKEAAYRDAPEKPTLPETPASIFERTMKGTHLGASSFYETDYLSSLANISRPLVPSNVSSPKIKKTNSYDVKVNVKKAKHGIDEALDPLYITFETHESKRSFAIDFRIHASNLPKPVKGQLNLKMP